MSGIKGYLREGKLSLRKKTESTPRGWVMPPASRRYALGAGDQREN